MAVKFSVMKAEDDNYIVTEIASGRFVKITVPKSNVIAVNASVSNYNSIEEIIAAY